MNFDEDDDDLTLEDLLKLFVQGGASVKVVSPEEALKLGIVQSGTDDTIVWIDENIKDKHKADLAVFNYSSEGHITH